jgi:uncharacterized cupredoxin-like copper-binding protein
MVVIVAVAWAGATGAGCRPTAHGSVADQRISVTVRDFSLRLSRSEAHAGRAVFDVRNIGPTHHEVIVVRADGHDLPFRRDGLTLDEDAMAHREAGGVEPMAAHASEPLTVTLRPGRYVVFCNMSGHYLAGMHADLEVT